MYRGLTPHKFMPMPGTHKKLNRSLNTAHFAPIVVDYKHIIYLSI